MTRFTIILSFVIAAVIACNFSNDKKVLEKKIISNSVINSNSYIIDTAKISSFNWDNIKDTTKYKAIYLQLNMFSFSHDKFHGNDILSYLYAIGKGTIKLTSDQQYKLFNIINNSANFYGDTCKNFRLNAGFLIIQGKYICGAINIGCQYKQWNFKSENKNSHNGAINEKGLADFKPLLYKIYSNQIPN